jgi:uncharacterized protein
MRILARFGFLLLVCAPVASGHAQNRDPIIDMHLHARKADYAGPDPFPMCAPFTVMPRIDAGKPETMGFNVTPPCENPIPAGKTDDQIIKETVEIMKRRNIIGMVSGEPELMTKWRAAGGDRIIPGLDLRIAANPGAAHVATRSTANVRQLHARGVFKVLGEVMAEYEGVPANDPRLEPYWALAEQMDIPVGIHMGPGGPGDPYSGSPGYRARNSNPLLLEDVLVRHPKLRVYIMHAGYPFLEPLRALMFSHPQVYVDIASIVYTEPRPAFYRYLQGIVEAGYGDRILFGSDQMIWPGVIEPSIQAIEEAPFLTPSQKRDILYNNAARFLRLSKEEIARHHKM